MNLLSLNYRIF